MQLIHAYLLRVCYVCGEQGRSRSTFQKKHFHVLVNIDHDLGIRLRD